jgi:hypothetical protein
MFEGRQGASLNERQQPGVRDRTDVCAPPSRTGALGTPGARGRPVDPRKPESPLPIQSGDLLET